MTDQAQKFLEPQSMHHELKAHASHAPVHLINCMRLLDPVLCEHCSKGFKPFQTARSLTTPILSYLVLRHRWGNGKKRRMRRRLPNHSKRRGFPALRSLEDRGCVKGGIFARLLPMARRTITLSGTVFGEQAQAVLSRRSQRHKLEAWT
jgi:hypothetical protein